MARARRAGNRRIDIRDRRLDGERMTLSAGTANRKEAEAREHSIRRLLDLGELDIVRRLRARELHIADVHAAVKSGDLDRLRRRNAEPLTLGAVLDRAMKTIEATTEPGTQKEYRTVARQLTATFGRDRDITTITKDDAEDWLHAPKKPLRKGAPWRPWSPGRQGLVRVLAGRIWQSAIDREAEQAEIARAQPRIRRNPWKLAEVKGTRVKRAAFLQPAEWRALAAKADERYPERLAFLALGCLAGLRMMEAANLRIGVDVDLERAVLHVQPREGAYAWKPKSDRSVRSVPIGAELLRILRRHVADGFAGDVYLLRLPDRDRPISPPTLQGWTRDAFEAAGIRYGREGDGLTYHSLRHTFASWLVQQDVQLLKVAHLLGDTVKMVEEVYGHLLPTDYEKAIAILDGVVTAEGA